MLIYIRFMYFIGSIALGMANANKPNPETMKVAELKYWLSQHNLPQKGRKAELIEQ